MENPKIVSCCNDPKLRGGRCDNCGQWSEDLFAPKSIVVEKNNMTFKLIDHETHLTIDRLDEEHGWIPCGEISRQTAIKIYGVVPA